MEKQCKEYQKICCNFVYKMYNSYKMKQTLYVLTVLILMISCATAESRLRKQEISYKKTMESIDKFSTYRTINLDTICNPNERYIEFESNKALILLNIKDFFDYASKRSDDNSLCAPKKQYLQDLIDTINNCSINLYFIEKMTPPEEWKRFSPPNYKNYKKNFIYPYGYEIKTDTVNAKKLDALENWMISEMCINGKCLIVDKKSNRFVNKIYYVITDFKNGHGGEDLLFEDKRLFFIVKIYTDIRWPDFDCMSKDEIQKWNEDVRAWRKK